MREIFFHTWVILLEPRENLGFAWSCNKRGNKLLRRESFFQVCSSVSQKEHYQVTSVTGGLKILVRSIMEDMWQPDLIGEGYWDLPGWHAGKLELFLRIVILESSSGQKSSQRNIFFKSHKCENSSCKKKKNFSDLGFFLICKVDLFCILPVSGKHISPVPAHTD